VAQNRVNSQQLCQVAAGMARHMHMYVTISLGYGKLEQEVTSDRVYMGLLWSPVANTASESTQLYRRHQRRRHQLQMSALVHPRLHPHQSPAQTETLVSNIGNIIMKQDHQALLKAKYCPRATPVQHFPNPGQLVQAVSCSEKKTQKPM